MDYITTITSKGQITIPVGLREALALKTGDKVEFVVHRDGSVTMMALNAPASRVFEQFGGAVMERFAASDDDAIGAAAVARDRRSKRKKPGQKSAA